LAQGPRRAFADAIKMLSDHSVRATVVLVGVADSVDQLISEHQSVERALVQIHMPRMSNDELNLIVSRGLKILGMEIDAPALNRMARLSQGFPHYTHLLALYASRAALDAHSLHVTTSFVDKAIERAIAGAQQSIRTDYEAAIRSPRKHNLYTEVLLACAMADTNELGFFAAQDVRDPIQQITGRDYDIPSFAQHLNDFCDKRGPILEKKGTRRLFRYRFRDPLLQPFVLMQGLKLGKITSLMLDRDPAQKAMTYPNASAQRP